MSTSPIHSFHLIFTLIFLLSLLSYLPTTSASATCSEVYGNPDEHACWQILFGSKGIPSDATSRFFSPPLRRRPSKIPLTQWRERQRLPFFWSIGDCKVALLAIHLADRTTTHDTSSWTDIAKSGSLVHNQCVAHAEREGGVHIPSGGYVLTGNHGALALIMYGSGSVYDKQVLSDIAKGRSVVAEQDPRYGDLDDRANASSTSPAVSIVDPVHPRARHAAASSVLVSEGERGGN